MRKETAYLDALAWKYTAPLCDGTFFFVSRMTVHAICETPILL